MKQILLIGDSIRMGYCGHVKELLADRADVRYPDENCSSSQNILIKLVQWANLCDREQVDIVCFNCGQWDAAHFNYELEPLTSLQEYRKNLYAIVRQLRKLFPKARLVFITTTPMNPDYPENCNPRTTEEINAYNHAAKQVMAELGIVVNDLFAAAESLGTEYYIDYCHFTPEGYKFLGNQVFECITSLYSDAGEVTG